MMELLRNVQEGNMTFAGLKQEASRIKEIKEVQHYFVYQKEVKTGRRLRSGKQKKTISSNESKDVVYSL